MSVAEEEVPAEEDDWAPADSSKFSTRDSVLSASSDGFVRGVSTSDADFTGLSNATLKLARVPSSTDRFPSSETLFSWPVYEGGVNSILICSIRKGRRTSM